MTKIKEMTEEQKKIWKNEIQKLKKKLRKEE